MTLIDQSRPGDSDPLDTDRGGRRFRHGGRKPPSLSLQTLKRAADGNRTSTEKETNRMRRNAMCGSFLCAFFLGGLWIIAYLCTII